MRRAPWFAALVAAALLLAGCASLPDTSTPEAIGTINRAAPSRTVPQPAPGREPDLLLRDFFKASTAPANRHIAARQYLTPAASKNWDDGASTTIVDKVDVLPDSRDDNHAVYVIRAGKVGQLKAGGIFQSDSGTLETKIGLSKVNGQWRIDDLPPGVIMDRTQFMSAYQRRSLYFLNPSGTTTVPDPRWVSADKDQLAAQLIGMLIDGPEPGLAQGVKNMLGSKVSLRGAITKADGRTGSVGVGLGGVRIDFQGIGNLNRDEREKLAAQVIWTLNNADVSGPYVLLADGKPLDDRHVDGWTTADVAGLNPVADTLGTVDLRAIRGGALVHVGSNGVTPVAGVFGTSTAIRSAAISRDGNLVAAVVDSGRPAPEPASTLMVGSTDGGAFPVIAGNTITRPTWAPDESAAWAVVDGKRVIRAVRDVSSGQVSLADTDTSAIAPLGRQITELRLSRDGARAALIVDGKPYVATVVPEAHGGYALQSPHPIGGALGAPARSLDWSTSDTIVIADDAPDTPVVVVPEDGSRTDPLPGQNLTPPVVAVSATATTYYVADSRSVFQLATSDPESDRYWREVNGLAGVQAIPVLPG